MLVFRILFVNHVQAAFATDNLVVGAALLDRGSYFHCVCYGCTCSINRGYDAFYGAGGVAEGGLLVAGRYTSLGKGVWRHFYSDAVPGEYLDVVHAHLARDVGCDFMSVFKFHTEHGVAE